MQSQTAPRARPRRTYNREPELSPLGKACALQVWSEETLLYFPWAVLDSDRPASLSYRGPSPVASRAFWRAGASGGMPGVFEREVFRACEWIAIEEARRSGGQVPDPFVFTGRSLCERLCLREAPGIEARLQGAFERLAGVRLKGTSISTLLELGDGFTSPWSEVGGLEGPRSIRFDAAFRASVKAGRTVALSWDAWIAGGPGARRLLEILAPAIAGRCGSDEISVTVAKMAQLLPYRCGSADRFLAAAHRDLLAAGILGSVQQAGTGSFARFTYRPGRAAEALRERVGARIAPTVNALTRELAAELGEREQGLMFLQRLLARHSLGEIEVAIHEVRLLRRQGRLKESPLAQFEGALAKAGNARALGAYVSTA